MRATEQPLPPRAAAVTRYRPAGSRWPGCCSAPKDSPPPTSKGYAAAELHPAGHDTVAWVADNLAAVTDALAEARQHAPLRVESLHRWLGG